MSDLKDLKKKKIHTAGNRNFHEKTTTSNKYYVFPQTLKFKKNQKKRK